MHHAQIVNVDGKIGVQTYMYSNANPLPNTKLCPWPHPCMGLTAHWVIICGWSFLHPPSNVTIITTTQGLHPKPATPYERQSLQKKLTHACAGRSRAGCPSYSRKAALNHRPNALIVLSITPVKPKLPLRSETCAPSRGQCYTPPPLVYSLQGSQLIESHPQNKERE